MGSSRLEMLLATAYIQLCLLYTCDRALRLRRAEGGWEMQLEYRGGQRPVRFPLREARPIEAQITAATLRGFAGLVDWCCKLRDQETTIDWAEDRLEFTQVRIAELLGSEKEPSRLATLVREINDVREALDDQWRAFIEDRFHQYLDKERQLEGVVNEVVATFGEKTTVLTKNLSDAMLAAVAALIGSAIAAAFKTPFNSALFRIGVLAYAGYLLVFPGLYGLGSQLGQFLETHKAFEQDRMRFNSLISNDRVNLIIGNRVTKAKSRYWKWFWLTIAGYVVAIVGSVLAAAKIPAIVA